MPRPNIPIIQYSTVNPLILSICSILSRTIDYGIIVVMKFLTFFIFVGIFFWVAMVPPDGMNKYPAVNVEFEYSQANGAMNMSVYADEYVQYDEAIDFE